MKKIVISLGGSVIYKDINSLNFSFLSKFSSLIRTLNCQVFIVVGGGILARSLQEVARKVTNNNDSLDELGILSTKINAKIVADELGVKIKSFDSIIGNENVVITYGTKPGASTDLVAVDMASKFDVDEVINITNVSYVYSNFETKIPVYNLSWQDYFKIFNVDSRHLEWSPGGHYPFDLIASFRAFSNGIKVRIMDDDIHKLSDLFFNDKFVGTLIK